MRFVGIDPSLSRTGVCVLTEKGAQLFGITAPRKDSVYDRQKKMVEATLKIVLPGDVVCLEDFGISARFAPSGRYVERIEMCGMLKYLLPRLTRLPWLSVPPSLLKSFAAGKASAKKEDVVRAVREKWKVAAKNDDEADAFALAAFAKSVVCREQGFPKQIAKFEEYGANRHCLKRIAFVANVS